MAESVLTCDTCGERYEPLLVVADEPCPKVACDGTLEARRVPDVRSPFERSLARANETARQLRTLDQTPVVTKALRAAERRVDSLRRKLQQQRRGVA